MSTSVMTPFQLRWLDHAARLGLAVTIPCNITVGAHTLEIPVLLGNFGGSNGMLLVTQYGQIEEHVDQLAAQGYGYSCLSEPGKPHPGDNEALIEMLQDWGWSGVGLPPAWLTGHAE